MTINTRNWDIVHSATLEEILFLSALIAAQSRSFFENLFNVKELSGQVGAREMTGRVMGKFIWSNTFTYLMEMDEDGHVKAANGKWVVLIKLTWTIV
ncbi:3873_t:CDS:2 [Paraglomus brasilianum]|uniref:3873_t:CDS:1 n=1 Tax=Paraglomus brasilianum TaxID=144538 RepID=A0A9N9CND1_9GLOM|nr:3873_t:CDS:2 [Paraglomus brasilianum]